MRLAKQGSPKKTALAAAFGATLPDIPMALGAAWLWKKRRRFSRSDFDDEVCGRSLFREPDAAFHSAIPIAAAIVHEAIANPRRDDPAGRLRAKEGAPANFASAFLVGWAGHVFVDFLTHGKDARPIFWPLSGRRFESPISYRDKERFGTMFTVIEHAAIVAVLILTKPAHFSLSAFQRVGFSPLLTG